jgi:hypothetical protein
MGAAVGRRTREALVAGTAALALVTSLGAMAWACVPMSTVTVTPDRVRPGDEVTVSGVRFLAPAPVVLHLHSHDGPVVATMEMPRSANTLFKTNITVPRDAPPGPLVVVATQDAFTEGSLAGWGVPARAVITVLDSAGNAPPTTVPAVVGRPADLAKESIDPATVVLVALGVAAVALLVVALTAAVAGRRVRAAVPQAVDR